jgi:hypothetical protein
VAGPRVSEELACTQSECRQTGGHVLSCGSITAALLAAGELSNHPYFVFAVPYASASGCSAHQHLSHAVHRLPVYQRTESGRVRNNRWNAPGSKRSLPGLQRGHPCAALAAHLPLLVFVVSRASESLWQCSQCGPCLIQQQPAVVQLRVRLAVLAVACLQQLARPHAAWHQQEPTCGALLQHTGCTTPWCWQL